MYFIKWADDEVLGYVFHWFRFILHYWIQLGLFRLTKQFDLFLLFPLYLLSIGLNYFFLFLFYKPKVQISLSSKEDQVLLSTVHDDNSKNVLFQWSLSSNFYRHGCGNNQPFSQKKILCFFQKKYFPHALECIIFKKENHWVRSLNSKDGYFWAH